MEKSIEIAADTVLAFLEGIPMSAGTVKYYRSCYRTIGRYCQSNDVKEFTINEAEAFSKYQMSRHEKGEISQGRAMILRKAAAMLADCMQTRK